MRFIDKNTYRQNFNHYSRQYLQDALNLTRDGFMPPLASDVTFECFSNKKYKSRSLHGDRFNGWLDILMTENQQSCCYCMRTLQSNEVSVEHLVPENFTNLNEDKELEFYFLHAPYLASHIMLGKEADALAAAGRFNINTENRIPHLIAHANLFTACKGNEYGCSCNNHRGNQRILPLMLMENVEEISEYGIDGKFYLYHPDTDASQSTLSALDINSDTLIKIRKLWYLFSRKNLRPDSDDNRIQLRVSMIYKAFDLTEDDVPPGDYIQFITEDPFYWDILLRYEYFFNYYLDKYPL